MSDKKRVCTWSTNDDWSQSGCGHEFTFNDGGPVENDFAFCPFCGGKLIAESEDES